MNGRCVYFAVAALLAILCSVVSFPLFFLFTFIYATLLVKYKHFSSVQTMWIMSIFLLFLISSQFAFVHNKTKIPANANQFVLEYVEDQKIDGDLLEILARDVHTREKLLLHYEISSEQEKRFLENSNFFGWQCKVGGTLTQPKTAKNENAFNYRRYLNHKRIFWILESTEMPLKGCIPEKYTLTMLIKQFRYYGIRDLFRHFPPETAALASALIYGDQSLIDVGTMNSYQKIGITHLLAISGLQVSMLIAMIFYLGIRFGATREAVTKFILFILPVYAVAAGGSPSVVRAVLMIFMVMAAIQGKTAVKLLPIDAISIAFCLYLLVDPFSIFDVGFQLSFAVSFVIIVSAPIILTRYHIGFAKMLAVTIASQLASLPILLYHFNGISLISIVANLIYIPLYSFLFLPSVYILAIWQFIFGTVPVLAVDLFTKLIIITDKFAKTLANLSFLDFVPGRPTGLELAIYIIGLVLVLVIWEKQYWLRDKRFVICLCCFLIIFQTALSKMNPVGEVSMIDVGQGDSILIHLPFGKGNYLIDTGGTLAFNEESWRKRADPFEVGKDVVVPFLKAKGIRKINKLILTHGDIDHIGGAFAVMNDIKIGQIILPAVAEPSDTEKKIMKLAVQKGIPVFLASTGDQWQVGSTHFLILSPDKNFTGERNLGSVALIARIGGLTWFFGGDLPKEGEEKIIKNNPNLSIDILKAGHHGSNTSSSELFLKRIKPKIAIISVGEKNRYGHPHKEVINRLIKNRILIYRTDKQGEIKYRFYHGKGTFSTFLP